MKDVYSLEIPMFSLEDFMVSMSYAPLGMTTNLARYLVSQSNENDLPAPMREVKIFKKALDLLPIGIKETDLIVGNYGKDYADPSLLDEIGKADKEEFENSEGYRLKTEDEKLISGRYLLFGVYTLAHTCLDYESIVNKGLKYFKKKILNRLNEEVDSYGRVYLGAMLESIDAVCEFSARYQALSEQEYAKCSDACRREELSRIINALKNVPYQPASDFFEALQSIWIMHTVVPVAERSWASISLGQMDQYLLPFYKKWIQDGNSQDEAVALLVAFYKLLDSYGDGSCALNFGPDFNELTGAMLKAEKTGRFRSPIVAVRMREDTPNEIYDQYIDKMLFEIGQPTFYGENPCVKSMEYRGNSKREGHSINSCMGMVVVGREIADMWGCCVNMNIPLELAVNCGKPLHGEFPQMLQKYLEGVSASVPRSMDDIRNSFARYIRKIVAYVANQNKQKAAWVAMHRPNPMLSLLLDDCIEFGRDRAHSGFHALGDKAKEFMENDEFKFIELRKGRGVRYHNVTVLATGFADVADSMSAIDELVYKQHKYTLEDIMEAARNNYEGSERVSKIYVDLKRCPKYANGSRVADINAAFVLDALADACEDEYTGNIRYLPTCHTIDSNVLFGNCVYASMDSRKDGEAFAKNAGPVLSVLKNTPTDLMWSASKLPQVRFSGGMPIDLYVMENLLSTKENCEKFRGLLKVYFEMGGMQVQVNSVNVELLKQAYNEPEKYPNVIVRKGGFSMYFTDMPKVTQKDMIERFEKESRS